MAEGKVLWRWQYFEGYTRRALIVHSQGPGHRRFRILVAVLLTLDDDKIWQHYGRLSNIIYVSTAYLWDWRENWKNCPKS